MKDYQKLHRILLVEDDEDDIMLFTDALTRISPPQTCTIARDGRDGIIKALTPPPYDFIFMDLNMPILNGYECMRQLKANRQLTHIPIIILSTSQNVYDVKKSQEMGASAYFTKPDNFNDWIKILEDILVKGNFITRSNNS